MRMMCYQNIFIKGLERTGKLREDSQLYTWLYRIATNESLSYLEQQKRKSSVSIDNEENPLINQLKAEKGI